MISWASFSLPKELFPNALSVLRGVLAVFLPFLLFQHSSSLHLSALILFILASLTDYWDGWLARKHHSESNWGKVMDPTMDKLLILAPLAAFALLDLYSVWWVVPIFFREIAVTFCRLAWMREGKGIAAERLGKIKLVFQVLAVSLAFLTFLSFDFAFLERGRAFFSFFMFLFLFLAVVLTLVSGFSLIQANLMRMKSRSFAEFTSAAGVGLSSEVPGTWGTLVGLILVVLTHFNAWLYAATFLFLFFVGYWAVGRLDLTADKDPRYVVLDEVLGIFVVFAGIRLSALSLCAGFFLFRLFDVLKPFPLRKMEQWPGYWGILCDDLGAGFYAWLILFFLAK